MNPWKKDWKKTEQPEKPPVFVVRHDPVKFESAIRRALATEHLPTRLVMLEQLYDDTHGASQPYVRILIKKCRDKIKQTNDFIF